MKHPQTSSTFFFPWSLIWSTMFASHATVTPLPVHTLTSFLGRRARPCPPGATGEHTAWWSSHLLCSCWYSTESFFGRTPLFDSQLSLFTHGDLGWQQDHSLALVPAAGMWKACAAGLCSPKQVGFVLWRVGRKLAGTQGTLELWG